MHLREANNHSCTDNQSFQQLWKYRKLSVQYVRRENSIQTNYLVLKTHTNVICCLIKLENIKLLLCPRTDHTTFVVT